MESNFIDWPEGLPVPLIDRSHPVDPRSVETIMESGRRRVRRTSLEPVEFIKVQWNFTADQYNTFRTFFIEDLAQGTAVFQMVTYERSSEDPSLLTVVTRVVAFLDGSYSESHSDNLFTVAAILEIDQEEREAAS